MTATAIRLLLSCFLAFAALAAQATEQPGKAGIASQHFLATEAGHEILAQGGNAFDAAIAVAAMLAVVEPTSSGLGGGGFWMLHRAEDGFETMVDARETAPAAAHRDMYVNEDGTVNRDLAVNGPLAGGIPGEVAGMQHLADNYGRLPLSASLQPAIRIARAGFAIDRKFHTLLGWRIDTVRRWPAAAEAYLVDGEMPPIGHVIRLPDLAWVLEQVAEHGADGFYGGPVAQKLVEGVREMSRAMGELVTTGREQAAGVGEVAAGTEGEVGRLADRDVCGLESVDDLKENLAVNGLDPKSGQVFPNIDIATKAAVMGLGVVMADLVLCRAGALTVSELAAAGVGAVLVPFPYAVDDHQTRNAQFLVEAGTLTVLGAAVGLLMGAALAYGVAAVTPIPARMVR